MDTMKKKENRTCYSVKNLIFEIHFKSQTSNLKYQISLGTPV